MHMCGCCDPAHRRYKGVKKLIVGVLILLNVFIWPKWLGIDGWITFFGALMILGGLVKLFWHPCMKSSQCCETAMPKPRKRKRRR